MFLYLGAFTKFRRAIISFVISVCLSTHMKQLGSHLTDFHSVLHMSIFQVPLVSDTNNG